MKLSREIDTKNEVQDFIKKFYGKKPYKKLKAINGKIVSCETTDPKLLKFAKEKGLT